MAHRPTLRTKISLERLESREVLTSGGPTAEMQELLEWTNFARQQPQQAAQWAVADLQTDNLGLTLKTFGVSPDQARNDIASRSPAQPLAWSPSLTNAASIQSQAQAERGVQGHDGGGSLNDGTPVGVTLRDRLTNAHYDQAISDGENAFAYAISAKNATKAFLIDWGNNRKELPHLTTLMNPANREAGFGIVETKNKGLGPKVVTEVFGSQAGSRSMLLGVAYNDTIQADRHYEAGEGQGDVTIDVTNTAGQTQSVNTWKSGGYQIALDKGSYTVTARVGDRVFSTQSVEIGDQNVKRDFVLSDPWKGTSVVAPPKPVVQVRSSAPAPVVVPAPAPTPAPAPVVVISTPAPAPVVVEAPRVVVEPTPVVVVTTAARVEASQVVPAAVPAVVPVSVPAAVVAPLSTTPTRSVDTLNSEALIWESW